MPEAAARPSVVPIVDRGRRTILRWHIAPAAASLEHMQDAADHPAIVDAGLAGFAARQMRLQAGPGTIRQPKQARHHTPPDQQSPFRRIEPKLRQEFVWVPYLVHRTRPAIQNLRSDPFGSPGASRPSCRRALKL